MHQPRNTETQFRALIKTIRNPELRMNVEGSAFDNAYDTSRELCPCNGKEY